VRGRFEGGDRGGPSRPAEAGRRQGPRRSTKTSAAAKAIWPNVNAVPRFFAPASSAIAVAARKLPTKTSSSLRMPGLWQPGADGRAGPDGAVQLQPVVSSRRVGMVTLPPGERVAVVPGPSTVTAGPDSSVTVVVVAPIETVNERPW
jgi:hypothetical protein